jgi:uncharacterized protein (DUF697 family)
VENLHTKRLSQTHSSIEALRNCPSLGCLTGLGSIVTLPVTVPSALGASWIIQARMCGAIAAIYGRSLKEDRVRTLVLLAMLGDSGKEILKDLGIKIGRRVIVAAIDRIPRRVLGQINKRVGFRLLTKAGERGLVNFTEIVPVVGGVVGGSFDAAMCVGVRKTAKRIFRTEKQSDA